MGGLEVPPHAADGEPDWLERSEAGRLLASSIEPGWPVLTSPWTMAEPLPSRSICERLDGIPLALELAAAQVRLMSVDAITKGLSDRFRLLVGTQRTGPPRHKTLLASIEWSCSSLDEDEHAVLRRLSVFASGFTLRAAKVVCAAGKVDAEAVPGLLTSLVDKSLVQALPGDNRFRLHETMRAYASAALEAEACASVRDRHLDYFTGLAEATEPNTWTGEFSVTYTRPSTTCALPSTGASSPDSLTPTPSFSAPWGIFSTSSGSTLRPAPAANK